MTANTPTPNTISNPYLLVHNGDLNLAVSENGVVNRRNGSPIEWKRFGNHQDAFSAIIDLLLETGITFSALEIDENQEDDERVSEVFFWEIHNPSVHKFDTSRKIRVYCKNGCDEEDVPEDKGYSRCERCGEVMKPEYLDPCLWRQELSQRRRHDCWS